MHFTNLLTAVAPLAALLSASAVDASSHHAAGAGHRAAARKHVANRAAGAAHPASKAAALAAAADSQAEALYRQAAQDASNGTTSANSKRADAKAPRKRKTCSSSTKSPVAPSASATGGAASSVVNVGAASSVVDVGAASSVVNVGAAVSTGSPSPSASLTSTKTSSAAPAATTSASQFDSKWKLDLEASGDSFFDSWTFWSWDDPTHGTVSYQDVGNAWNKKLISINDQKHAIMTVDQTKVVTGGRESIRIHSTYVFNGGLILMDAHHMPTGCGSWPAWWANGPNWPHGGEIDILEGVNDFGQNQVSIHTGPGCTIPTDYDATGVLTTGNFNSYDCSSANTDNQGCGQRDAVTPNAYGVDFNNNGGGVYAMKWDSTGIQVYFFPREAIPADITANEPMPDTWGRPMGDFPSDNCNPYQFFTDNFAIFDTTFCGDWAGNVWNFAGYAGQDVSCAAKTGYATCSDYVLNNGDAFSEAYWEVAYVKYFQPK